MNRLDRLIKELCPNGVEWKTLGSIGTITRGNGLQKSDFSENGIKCIHYGQIYTYYGMFSSNTKSFVLPETAAKLKKVSTGDIIIAITSENIEDVCKCVVWLGEEDIVTGGHTAILKHNQNPKYIAYYLQTASFFEQKRKIANGTKVIEVSPKKLEKIKLPVPPLPIQEEIVRILDNFTELTAELTVELTARKKQYEYYRDSLLSFSDEVEWKTLEKISTQIFSGGTPDTSRRDYYGGKIPWLRTQEINWVNIFDTDIKITEEGLNNSSAKWVPSNCVIVAMYGATAAKACINKIPLTTNQACCNLQINEQIALYRYVFHWLRKSYKKLKSLGQGSQSNINAKFIKNFKIPVPPLSEQERIVSILDKFDALVNDISIGLPAEIQARQKQYEYYRDKLLSFKEAANEQL